MLDCVFFHLKGVTLTDLQEAEKTIQTMKTDNKGREKEEEKEKEAKQKKGEEGVRAGTLEACWLLSLCNTMWRHKVGDAVFTGIELEVSYCQPAEVRPAGPHTTCWHT